MPRDPVARRRPLAIRRRVLLVAAAVATAVVASAAVGGCARRDQVPSRRANRVLADVVAGVQLGAMLPAGAAAAAAGMAREAPEGAGDVPPPFRVVRVVTASTRWDQVRGAATEGVRSRRDRPIEVVYLQSTDTARAAALVERITATFGVPPTEACAGLDDVAVDRVLVWRAGDRGGIALALPLYRAAGSVPLAQLVAYAGRWRADRVEIGFEPGPCPPSRLGERR